jgi:hypothetical protein
MSSISSLNSQQSENKIDLFPAASKDEIKDRLSDRVKNCKHVWSPPHLTRIPLLLGHYQIGMIESCGECRAKRQIFLLLDSNHDVLRKEVSIREWSSEDQKEEERKLRERRMLYGVMVR